MRKILSFMLTLALVLGLSLGALAQEPSAQVLPAPLNSATLVVSGTNSVGIKSDLATIELGAQTRGRTVGEAHQENIRIIDAVIAALEAAGVQREDIRTSSYYVYFEPDGSMTGAVASLISGNFTVTNMLSVTIRDIDSVSTAIDAASAAGANNIYSLIFQSSKRQEAYHQALQGAVADARAKAEVLALAAGKTLGSLVKLESNELMGTPFESAADQKFAGEMATSTPILAGDVIITASVLVTFNLD